MVTLSKLKTDVLPNMAKKSDTAGFQTRSRRESPAAEQKPTPNPTLPGMKR